MFFCFQGELNILFIYCMMLGSFSQLKHADKTPNFGAKRWVFPLISMVRVWHFKTACQGLSLRGALDAHQQPR